MGERQLVNSEPTWNYFVKWARSWYDKHHYVTFDKPHIGPDRSIDQNSLLHLWLTQYAAHLLNKEKKQVTKGELAGMKTTAKREYYLQYGYSWMVLEAKNPRTGEIKTAWASSADYKRGDMYHFMTWLQDKAATDGLILESKGEYAKLKREEDASVACIECDSDHEEEPRKE